MLASATAEAILRLGRIVGRGLGRLIRVRHVIALVTLALAGCSNFAPYETQTPNLGPNDQRRETTQEMVTAAGANPADAPVSVCYSRLASTPDQVKAVAASECGKGATPVLVDQGMDLTACSLLIPVRATFSCAAH
ncbi:MAG: hypothetical protein ACREEL_10570 [Stellaceae bacterium]